MIPPICLTKDNCPVYPGSYVYVINTKGRDQAMFVSLYVVGLVHQEDFDLEEYIPGSGLYRRVYTRNDLVEVKVSWHREKKREGELIHIPVWVIEEKCRGEMQAADIAEGQCGYPEPPSASWLPEEDDPVTYAD